jgi:hypothetical protein
LRIMLAKMVLIRSKSSRSDGNSGPGATGTVRQRSRGDSFPSGSQR